MRIIHKTLLGFALTGALIASSAQVLAGPAARHSLDPSVTVRFADLNLSSAEGARTLYGRIRSAAKTVCGPRQSIAEFGRMGAWKRCYRTAIDEAVTQVDRPTLTALHGHMRMAKPG
jgi:UrcA family protein